MKRVWGRRRFGALVEPQGIYLLEYRLHDGGVQIIRQIVDRQPCATVEEAATRLATAVEAQAGKGARESVTLHGFDVTHQILVLPAAPDEVLRPLVEREMRRLAPEIADPIVAYVRGGTVEQRGHQQQEILAVAAPRATVHGFRDAFAARGLELEHMTVVPRALQRLYTEMGGPPGASGVVLALPGGEILGFFYDREMHLVMDPPVLAGPSHSLDAQLLLDQIERGGMYFRQQFRGAALEHILLAVDDADRERLETALRERYGDAVKPFPGGGPPAALAALGGILDSESNVQLNLLGPRAAKPPVDRKRVAAVAGAVAVAVAGLFWAWSGVKAAEQANLRLEAARTRVSRVTSGLSPMREAALERQSHAERVGMLETVRAERLRVQQILGTVALASAPVVQLSELQVTRGEEAWQASVAGMAAGESTAAAMRAVDRLYRELPGALAIRELTLEQLEYVDEAAADSVEVGATAGDGVGVRFRINFVVPPESPDGQS